MNKLQKFLISVAKPIIIKKLTKIFEDEETKKMIIEKVNKKFDLPKLDEKQEAEYLKRQYELNLEILKIIFETI